MTAPNDRRDVASLTQALRGELKTNYGNIPSELKVLKAWVVWRMTKVDTTTGKFNKIPHYPSGNQRSGEQGSPSDRAALGTFEEAFTAFEGDPRFAGVGLAMLPGMGYAALDVDHCITPGENIPAELLEMVDDTYAEISPSGTGIRAFWRGEATNGRNIPKGYELYSQKQFVTATGNQVDTMHAISDAVTLPVLAGNLKAHLEAICRPDSAKPAKSRAARLPGVATGNPTLDLLHEAGAVERDMGHGKYSILCPFESEHSDPDRAPGDGDTVYLAPHTNGHASERIECSHSHCKQRTQADFFRALGIDRALDGFEVLEDWPDPLPLPADLPPVMAFDLDWLPDAFRPLVADLSERMQVAPDFAATGILTTLSAAVGRRVQIMPKAHDDWTVVPNLWGAVVAPPGYMKSPVLSEVMRPLRHLEDEANKAFEADLAAWAADKERVTIVNSALKEKAKATLKKDPDAEIPDPQPEPEQPRAQRFVVNNFSMEALGEVMIGNPNGVLAFSDEIHGLLQMAVKPGNEGLNDFLLSAWNGDSPFAFDRIGRGLNRRIDYVCMAVLGGIQPGRLLDYVMGAVHGGANDSGLLQRFQLLCWPDMPKTWKLVDRVPDKAARDAAHEVFYRVAGCDDFSPDSGPDVRRFDDAAQHRFYEWLEELETLLRGDSLHPFMQSHLSKYRSLVPSLALILAVADGLPGAVTLPYLEKATAMAAYLRSHAERVYACAVHPATRNARALLAKIKGNDLLDGFAARDVYRNAWTLLDKDGTERAISLLCDFDYLAATEQRGPEGGRPKLSYRINPRCAAQRPDH